MSYKGKLLISSILIELQLFHFHVAFHLKPHFPLSFWLGVIKDIQNMYLRRTTLAGIFDLFKRKWKVPFSFFWLKIKEEKFQSFQCKKIKNKKCIE